MCYNKFLKYFCIKWILFNNIKYLLLILIKIGGGKVEFRLTILKINSINIL